MQNQPNVVVEADRNAFPNPAQADYRAALGGRNRGMHGSQEKGTVPPDPIQRLPEDARVERLQVDRDIG